MKRNCTLIMPAEITSQLFNHLFPGDGDEHGAVIAAGIVHTGQGLRLLARDLFLAKDGVDYVPGQRGYRMLHAKFIQDKILHCRELGLCYLAIHNHGGKNFVQFSNDDLKSHHRGYPALLDINRGQPVGGLVFAENAVAGDIWISPSERLELDCAILLGSTLKWLYPALPRQISLDPLYDRQTRLYGDVGQAILERLKIGVIGVGGVGSLVVHYLARLGVGHIVMVDNDRIELSNLPRVDGATGWHARAWLARSKYVFMRDLAKRIATPKVKISRHLVKRANPKVIVDPIFGDIVDESVARQFVDCDYLFLAADTMQARLVFNALVNQYSIPGVQIGSKVTVNKLTGGITDIYSVLRPVDPGAGCLYCNGLINSARLQKEAATSNELAAQAYVDDPNVIAPSVISLNVIGAGHAVDEFMLRMVGLSECVDNAGYLRFLSRTRDIYYEKPRKDITCRFCGRADTSRLARGDGVRLPVRIN